MSIQHWLGIGITTWLAACSFDQTGPGFGDASGAPPDTNSAADAVVVLADARTNDASSSRTDGATSDGSIVDAPPPDGPCGDIQIEPSNFDKCDLGASNGDLNLTPGVWRIRTDTLTLEGVSPPTAAIPLTVLDQAQPGGPNLIVVLYDSMTIQAGATVAIRGSAPIALVAKNNLTIAGELYVGGENIQPGAGGGLLAFCASGTGATGGVSNGVGAGGGGGGFGSGGGAGAAGENSGGTASPGGMTEPGVSLVPLRGGCNGGAGGNGGGTGGGGGGAVQLVAGGSINISGRVNVRGGGGRGAAGVQAGGGGGGSGGAILLEAPTVTVSGYLSANGGGGGEGSYSGGAFAGLNGADGLFFDEAAAGGSGGGLGGDGGAGGADILSPAPGLTGMSGNTPGAGGGGGGGGVGRIHIRATDLDTSGGTLSPPAQ